MKHIYYKNDFAVEITLLNASGEVVAPPDWQWHIEFTDGRRKYICSVDNGNAKVVGNTIMCYLDNHKFCCGEIGYKFVQAIPDLNYLDGFQNLITPKALPIELWEQESDNDVNIQSSVVPAYVVYDAYMTAKANGYTGTADEFYDALNHIVDINKKEADRVEAEANRVTAEQQRVENFVAMESALTTATNKANTATIAAEQSAERANTASDNADVATSNATQATTQATTATKRANDISADLEAKREADYWRGPKGEKGDKGDKGDRGEKGDQGERGLQGVQGVKGDDGVSPTVTTSKTGKVTTIEITDAQGTHTATVNDGDSVEVVQSTGTSTTAVMSQKAVSNIVDELELQVIYDVTANNSGATFDSLSALLSNENLSTLIPSEVRCGGMSIRFIQSSDNKYVEYFLTNDEWSIVTSDWEKINLENELTDNYQFSIVGNVTSSGVIETNNAAKRTDFINVFVGLIIKGYDGASKYTNYRLVSFFDKQKKWISCLTFDSPGIKTVVLSSENIPNNAKYVIAGTLNDLIEQSEVTYERLDNVETNISSINKEIEDIQGISFIDEKTYTTADSKIYFEYLDLSANDTIEVSLSGTAVWSYGWLYGSAGEMLANAISPVKNNNKYTITLSSATQVFGLRIYTLTTNGTVNIRLTIKKGVLDYSKEYTDSQLDGVNAYKISGNITIPWETTYANKYISAEKNHALDLNGYGIMKIPCSVRDRFTLDKLVSANGTAVISIVADGYSGSNTFYVKPVVLSVTERQHYEYTCQYNGSILICAYIAKQTPIIQKLSCPTFSNLDAASVWKDKKIVCFGDSLTEFRDVNGFRYSDWIEAMTGAEVINVGIGGSQIRQRTSPVLNPSSQNQGYAGLDMINLVKAACGEMFDESNSYVDVITNAANYIRDTQGDDNTEIVSRLLSIDWNSIDIITIFSGTNDWNNGDGNWGESGSSDVNTTLGAINEIIRLILTTYPHIKIYWFTPIIRWLGERIPENFSDNLVKGTKTLKEFSAMIQTEVVRHHIPVCDMYNTLGWNMYNFSNYFTNTDGTHPYKGFMAIARKFKGFIDANRTF